MIIQDREEKCQSLQLSLDRISLTLAKTAEGETSLKTRVQSLNQTLSQSNFQAADLQQKLGGIQNAFQSSEAERRVAQDKLDQSRYVHILIIYSCMKCCCCFSRSQISELKKQNHELLERVHHLQNEVTDSDMRRHELDNQLRNANLVRIKSNAEEKRENFVFSYSFNDKKANKKRFKRFRH